MEEEDRLQELKQNPMDTFSPELARMLIIQKYDRVTGNAKKKQTSKGYWRELS